MYENLVIGARGRRLVGDQAPRIVTAPVHPAAVARWQERHPEAGASGPR